MPFGYDGSFETADLGSLTSAGVTASQKTTGANLTFQVSLSGVGTNVVIRLEGSLDDTNYFNLAASNVDYTLTSNGTYGYVLMAPVQYVRLRLVSLTGGTPTVATKVGVI
jgi:hypothetical protein